MYLRRLSRRLSTSLSLSSFPSKYDRRRVSAVEHRNKEKARRRSEAKISLKTRIESSFLNRPHPFMSIYLMCLVVVMLLVIATTAVERIELPLIDTLVEVRSKCFELEEAYEDHERAQYGEDYNHFYDTDNDVGVGNNNNNKINQNGGGGGADHPTSFMERVISDFGDVSTVAGGLNGSATRATLPWPLPMHQHVLFNVLLLADEYVKGGGGGGGGSSDHHNNAATASSNHSINNVNDHLLAPIDALYDVGQDIAEQIEATMARIQSRLATTTTASSPTIGSDATASTASSAKSTVEIQYRTEVATIRNTAMDEALEFVGRTPSVGTTTTQKGSSSSSSSSSNMSPLEQSYRKKLLAKEQEFLAKHYAARGLKPVVGSDGNDHEKKHQQYQSLSPTLKAAVRVANVYELPHKYRMPLAPHDGHPSQYSQITFLVMAKGKKTAADDGNNNHAEPSNTKDNDGKEKNDAYKSNFRCTIGSSNELAHYVCLLELGTDYEDYMVNTITGGNSAPTASSSSASTTNRYTNAVGTTVAKLLNIKDYKPLTVTRWYHQRMLQSCARSFAYLKRVIDLLEEHPRAAFPEELRPLWRKFLDNFFFSFRAAAATEKVSSGEQQEEQNPDDDTAHATPEKDFPADRFTALTTSRADLAAAYIHALLSHPSLIPEQTFPLDQLIVMYMPLLLPFVGAIMQCIITIKKYGLSQKRQDKEAEEYDKRQKAKDAARREERERRRVAARLARAAAANSTNKDSDQKGGGDGFLASIGRRISLSLGGSGSKSDNNNAALPFGDDIRTPSKAATRRSSTTAPSSLTTDNAPALSSSLANRMQCRKSSSSGTNDTTAHTSDADDSDRDALQIRRDTAAASPNPVTPEKEELAEAFKAWQAESPFS